MTTRTIRVARTLTAAFALTGATLLGCGCAAEAPRAPSPVLTVSVPSPTPLTPAQQLLADSDDPSACAISFVLDGVDLDPQLQTEGRLPDHLPLPRAEGRVFAGWYVDAAAAEAASADPASGAGNPATRVNGSALLTCTQRERTLFGAWTTPDAVAAAAARVPILMYHQFTEKPGGEAGCAATSPTSATIARRCSTSGMPGSTCPPGTS